jgi:hypothetical protein
LESERTIGEDWVVRYSNRFFQLEPQSRHYAPARDKVLVCEGRHGSLASTEGMRCAGRRSRHRPGRMCWSSEAARQVRRGPSGSGCPR